MIHALTDFQTHQKRIAIIGLGYVGLPLLIELAKYYTVVGFDVDKRKIADLQNNSDRTNEINTQDLKQTTASFTHDPTDIKDCAVKIVTVPTPIDANNKPDLTLLKQASSLIGRHCQTGDIVVYESTVYPGVTEDICGPLLEKESGLSLNNTLFLGYSPERLSPGDNARTLTKIVKVVAGSTPTVSALLTALYGSIIPAGIHTAPTIQVAEAAKVIENTQRDLNVALMNELSIIFNKLKIDTHAVIEAAATKWNFMKMTPGLVGGHCIDVGPYYLTYKAQELGYHPDVILAGRRINDSMGSYVAQLLIKQLIEADIPVKRATVGIFGLTFKENVSDIRNSKVVDMIHELHDFGVQTQLCDPHAHPEEAASAYNLTLTPEDHMTNLDAIVLAVPHHAYCSLSIDTLCKKIKHDTHVILDIKKALTLPNPLPASVRYCSL